MRGRRSKGKGRKFGRETAPLSRVSRGRNPLPVPFQTKG